MAYEIARSVVSGRKAVAAAGTAEQLVSTSTHCFMIIVCADLGNSNPVVIGNSSVVAAEGSQVGTVLVPGNPPLLLLIDDVNKIYVDAITNNDAVCYTYFVP